MSARRGAWLARVLPVAGIVAAAAAIPTVVIAATVGQRVMIAPVVHLMVVGAAGALAAAAAVALSLIAGRLNDRRAVLLGTAFCVMATMLLVHALATPGILVGHNGLMQLAGALNIPAGAAILTVSALPALDGRPHRGGRSWVPLVLAAVLLVTGALALIDAGRVPPVPRPGSTLAGLVFVVGAGALTLLAWRAGRTHLLTRRISDLLVMVGLVWLIIAQYGLLNYGMTDLPWWVAHGLEVAGIGLIGIPAALDLRYGAASRPLEGDLRAGDLVTDEEALLGGRVRALMRRLAAKDPSTEDHARRVAVLAVQIGERLWLAERWLRLLAVGGLLHDIGKLAVPTHILTKPGPLTEEEYSLVRRHPEWGRDLLAGLGGFPPLVLRLVEGHHERLDASGYPKGRAAGNLELEVRILMVADVYDALTDDRVYRPAWPAWQAFELLDSYAGKALDRGCVEALHDVLSPAPTPGMTRGARTHPPRRPRRGR